MLDLVEGNNFQSTFGNCDLIDRHIVCNKNFAMANAAGRPIIWTKVSLN